VRPDALQPYEDALHEHAPLWMWDETGRPTALGIDRWRRAADDTDLSVVRRARSPVLDVGCGPGRIVAAMAAHGRLSLGIDVSRSAVSITRARGLNVVRRDVFDTLPGEGRWATIVVLDGSIGIGGDLPALLARLRQVIADDGELVVETHPDAGRLEAAWVRLGSAERPLGPAFPWTSVGAEALRRLAPAAGFTGTETWSRDGRTFAALAPTSAPSSVGAPANGPCVSLERVE
jgi:SAM-dependent methyltransferase